jgi:hypothetical protein
MEEKLRRLKLRPPSTGLRDRILNSARAEATATPVLYGRILRSEAFWISAAAAVLLVFALHLFSVPAAPPETYTTALSPDAEALAETLSEMLDDGAWLTHRFAVRLPSVPQMPTAGRPTLEQLLGELE